MRFNLSHNHGHTKYLIKLSFKFGELGSGWVSNDVCLGAKLKFHNRNQQNFKKW